MSVRNITRVFREATEGQMADGIAWYADAHTIALGLDQDDVDQAAGVIAALSPQTPWDRNVVLATRLYVEGDLTGGALGHSIRNAKRIHAGENWREVFGPKALKVRNFAQCIADPAHPDSVCVDRHAVDIANGVASNGEAARGLTPARYEETATEYRKAAKILGVSPAQCQAVTWVVWRETRIRYAAAVRLAAGR